METDKENSRKVRVGKEVVCGHGIWRMFVGLKEVDKQVQEENSS